MAISSSDQKLLWTRAGNQCSMPGCTAILASEQAVFGEVAHIRPHSPDGPRGVGSPGSDDYENLILLCERHHKEIDANPSEWPVKRLQAIKKAHETSVRRAIEKWKQLPDVGSLIVFCGASSIGKDVVSSRVRRNLFKQFGYQIDFVDKYTTRRKRSERESTDRNSRIPGSLYEPSSAYQFLSPDELCNNPDSFFIYRKYGGHLYAFSRQHLKSRVPEDRNLACILGALDRIDSFRSQVEKEFNRVVFAVLLTADIDELYERLDLRSTFTAEEREHRRSEIREDLERIELQRRQSRDLKRFYDLVIDNGRAILAEVTQSVTDGIGQWLRWRDWTLEGPS